jgi:Ca2+-binding EF-hand superfamily protein
MIAASKTILSCFVVTSFAFSSFADAQGAADSTENHPRAVLMMSNTDMDGDGQFSKAEYMARAENEAQKPKLERGFRMFDADRNGFVSYAELNARFAKVHSK